MHNTFTNLLIHVINKPLTMLTSYYFRIANHSSSESLILFMTRNVNVQLRKIASQSFVIKQEILTLTPTSRILFRPWCRCMGKAGRLLEMESLLQYLLSL